ncbi:hypothetical protein BRADI_5g08767v3 [Brachypodium distachyon]|uniref:Uncharacterized protein n=1 Tax=Brachypodium distachyon TaxID=15368 RepID=A0A2K2CG21_BRADI|nr:hypothetical protein BRADI_5g08767v3 [Brachypodium distachyon]
MSSLMMDQHEEKNRPVKPSGPRHLSGGRFRTAIHTSSSEKSLSGPKGGAEGRPKNWGSKAKGRSSTEPNKAPKKSSATEEIPSCLDARSATSATASQRRQEHAYWPPERCAAAGQQPEDAGAARPANAGEAPEAPRQQHACTQNGNEPASRWEGEQPGGPTSAIIGSKEAVAEGSGDESKQSAAKSCSTGTGAGEPTNPSPPPRKSPREVLGPQDQRHHLQPPDQTHGRHHQPPHACKQNWRWGMHSSSISYGGGGSGMPSRNSLAIFSGSSDHTITERPSAPRRPPRLSTHRGSFPAKNGGGRRHPKPPNTPEKSARSPSNQQASSDHPSRALPGPKPAPPQPHRFFKVRARLRASHQAAKQQQGTASQEPPPRPRSTEQGPPAPAPSEPPEEPLLPAPPVEAKQGTLAEQGAGAAWPAGCGIADSPSPHDPVPSTTCSTSGWGRGTRRDAMGNRGAEGEKEGEREGESGRRGGRRRRSGGRRGEGEGRAQGEVAAGAGVADGGGRQSPTESPTYSPLHKLKSSPNSILNCCR